MLSDSSLNFLDEEIEDERCKGVYLKAHREVTLNYELAWWSP